MPNEDDAGGFAYVHHFATTMPPGKTCLTDRIVTSTAARTGLSSGRGRPFSRKEQTFF